MKIVNESDTIKEFRSLGIYDPKLYPIKIYCANFSKRKLGVMRCSKKVFEFLTAYLANDMINNIGIDNKNIGFINFKNPMRLKDGITGNFGAGKNLSISDLEHGKTK